jgi:EREBP-like factor
MLTKRNNHGLKGVRFTRDGSWNAYIYHEKRNRSLGTYETAEEAARVYDREARRIWGQLAQQNFPGEL